MLSYLGIVETLLTAMLFIYVKNFPDSNYLVQSLQIIGIPVNRVTSEVVFMTWISHLATPKLRLRLLSA